MATIKDIAKHAGVSISTVSHVLNKTRHVSIDATQRVLNAVELYNYSPSALARSLKSNQTKTLGMLITSSTNPFFSEVLKGVDKSCYEQGYHLILCHTENDPSRTYNNINLLLQKRVDGLLIMCSMLDKESLNLLNKNRSIPVVMLDWDGEQFQCDKLQDSAEQGGFLATEYLIQQGHQSIGCITGDSSRLTARLRCDGFIRAMNQYQLPIVKSWIVAGDFEYHSGVSAFDQLIKKNGEQLPTALFVCNDAMAIGVYKSAAKHGIIIPDALSVIGYDNIELAQYLTPGLTTLQQQKERLGEDAIELLIDHIEHPERLEKTIQYEPTILVRGSVSRFKD